MTTHVGEARQMTFQLHDGGTRITVDLPWERFIIMEDEYLALALDATFGGRHVIQLANDGTYRITAANSWAVYRVAGRDRDNTRTILELQDCAEGMP